MLIENTMAGGCNPVGYNSDDWFRDPPSDAVELLPKEMPLDPSEPWPIPLPPEPPRDRWIEAVDAEGTVHDRWKWRKDCWVAEDGGFTEEWKDVVSLAISDGRSLRSVPAKDGEQS